MHIPWDTIQSIKYNFSYAYAECYAYHKPNISSCITKNAVVLYILCCTNYLETFTCAHVCSIILLFVRWKTKGSREHSLPYGEDSSIKRYIVQNCQVNKIYPPMPLGKDNCPMCLQLLNYFTLPKIKVIIIILRLN